MEKKEILLKLRQETGMNRREFAEYFGIPYRTVQEWELGHREMPGYLLRLMYYHEKTKEKEQLLPKMQSEDGKISIVRDVDGKNIVIINDIRFRGKRKIKWDEVEKYLREYVKKYYEIEAYSDKIYIGKDFPDDASFARYGGGFTDKGDWRRSNVNLLIKKIHETVREIKPWVKFGVSPFGIYRNESSDPLGSKTRGLQNYDDLYADVLLWAREGWIDYNIPQIYWQIGHPVADYETLIKWWAKNTENRPLFIGQSVMNTIQNADPSNPSVNQLPRKMALQRAYQTIGGSCQWPASAVVENAGKYRDALMAEYHKYPALPPVFDFMDNEAPNKVRKVKPVWTADGYILFWTAPKYREEMNRAVQYVVYRFDAKEKVDIDDPSHIVAITRDNFYKLPYEDGKTKYRYVVTALDRLHNESKSVGKKVKL